MATSDFIYTDIMNHLLASLTLPNRLIMEVVLATGLRISDVLSLRTDAIMKTKSGCFSFYESKTHKKRKIYIPKALLIELRNISGRYFVFENRLNPNCSRTRQAVWRDLKRASKLFRIPNNLVITPHSGRKIFAVSKYSKHSDPARARDILNHGSNDVALLYCLADSITIKHHPELSKYLSNQRPGSRVGS